MKTSAKNVRRHHIIPRTWRLLRVTAKSPASDEAQLRLRIGELEELIVGAEEKDARRRAAGILPPDNPRIHQPVPLRHAERQALQLQRLTGLLSLGALALLFILAASWLVYRLFLVF